MAVIRRDGEFTGRLVRSDHRLKLVLRAGANDVQQFGEGESSMKYEPQQMSADEIQAALVRLEHLENAAKKLLVVVRMKFGTNVPEVMKDVIAAIEKDLA